MTIVVYFKYEIYFIIFAIYKNYKYMLKSIYYIYTYIYIYIYIYIYYIYIYIYIYPEAIICAMITYYINCNYTSYKI